MHTIWPGRRVAYSRQNMKTSITQIWMVCHLLPFAKVGQHATSIQVSTGFLPRSTISALYKWLNG